MTAEFAFDDASIADQIVVLPTASGTLQPVERSATPVATDWIIQGMVARGCVTMLAGAAKAGKSILALQYAAAAAARFQTVYVDAENGATVIQQRLAHLPVAPRVYEARGFNLDDGIAQLETIILAGCDFLVLDSWVSLWSGSESSVRDVCRSLEAIRTLAQQFNIGVLLIHHTTKGSSTYRGSGAIAGSIEAVFTLTRGETPGARVLACAAMRMAAEPAEMILTIGSEGIFRQAEAVAPATTRGKAAASASAAGRAATRQPSPREIIRLREQKVITKREARRYLGQPTRWWRR